MTPRALAAASGSLARSLIPLTSVFGKYGHDVNGQAVRFRHVER